jgi:uncharacterized protein YggT (Ycf19 family)
MGLVDFLLNIAAILLWLNWRAGRFDPLARTTPLTLAGTLKRTEPNRLARWYSLLAIPALLLFRAMIYWQLGSAVDWNPSLRLGAVAVTFRSDFPGRILLFSLLSFAVSVFVLYLCFLLLSLAHGRAAQTESNPLQRWVSFHLGPVDRWPAPVKALLPFLTALLLWFPLSWLLAAWKVVPPAVSAVHQLEQAAVIGLSAYLPLKHAIGGVLALWLLTSYVYLGRHSFWSYVSQTGRRLLLPLRWLPLQWGRVDFGPVVGIALVFSVAEWAERGLILLYQRLPL